MARWAFFLGGLIVWAVHFMGLYAIASLADTVSRADAYGWRMAGLLFSGLCLLAALGLLLAAVWRLRLGGQAGAGGGDRFVTEIAALGAGISALAILWQALPTLTGY